MDNLPWWSGLRNCRRTIDERALGGRGSDEPRMRDRIGPERAGRGHCAGAGRDARGGLRGRGRAGRRCAHACRSRCRDFCTTSARPCIRLPPDRRFSPRCRSRITAWNGFTARRRWRIRSTMVRRWCWSATWSMRSARLGADGKLWRGLMQPAADDWMDFAEDTLGPALRIPRHPLRMARFGLSAIQSAQGFAKSHFVSPRTRAVFAGLAGHSFLSFDQPLTATIGWMFGITVHAVGWPIPRGGAQRPHSGAHRIPEDAGRNGAHFVPHRRGCLPRVGVEK